MRLLFDQNLSPRLAEYLADVYPDSTHAHNNGLEREADLGVWRFARAQEYVIVTRDSDFSDLSTVLGSPPQVIWIRRGNCSTREIATILRLRRQTVIDFAGDPGAGVLALF